MQYWPKTDEQKKQAFAFAIGEGTSYVSAPGVLVFCEDVFPNQMDSIKRTISKSIIEPNLTFFEKVSTLFGEKKSDANDVRKILQDPKKRAYDIADTLVKFGVANFLGGSLVSIGVQNASEKMMKTPTTSATQNASMRVSEFVGHYGSAAILGTVFSPFAERAKEVVSKILTNIGVSKKDADNVGFASVYTVIPEMVGTAMGWLTMMRGMGKRGASPRM